VFRDRDLNAYPGAWEEPELPGVPQLAADSKDLPARRATFTAKECSGALKHIKMEACNAEPAAPGMAQRSLIMKRYCSPLLLVFLLLPPHPCVSQAVPELVFIEGGTFLMGDLLSEGEQDELPVHPVTVGDFLLSSYEVTVAEFTAFVNETGYVTSAEGPFDPEAFGMHVTECVHAEVFRQARMDGDIGHAAVCSRDFNAAVAFNSNFRLERTQTLMQGDDHCNHRYIDLA
jgi:formylglycine-generating enzyme required for sulfatase activity